MKHCLYKTGDKDAPDFLKDRNGEVCLAMCRYCKKGERELDYDPNCPGGKKQITLSEEVMAKLKTTKHMMVMHHFRLQYDLVERKTDITALLDDAESITTRYVLTEEEMNNIFQNDEAVGSDCMQDLTFFKCLVCVQKRGDEIDKILERLIKWEIDEL